MGGGECYLALKVLSFSRLQWYSPPIRDRVTLVQKRSVGQDCDLHFERIHGAKPGKQFRSRSVLNYRLLKAHGLELSIRNRWKFFRLMSF